MFEKEHIMLNELLETNVEDYINYLRMNETVGFPE